MRDAATTTEHDAGRHAHATTTPHDPDEDRRPDPADLIQPGTTPDDGRTVADLVAELQAIGDPIANRRPR